MEATLTLVPIAEGKGEVEALPLLLRRLASGAKRRPTKLQVNRVIRVKAGSFFRDEAYLDRHMRLAAAKAARQSPSLVVILLDCEDECPAKAGPELKRRAQARLGGLPLLVALAHREYETWFLAAAKSLRGVASLPSNLEPPPNPEAKRGAKEWLSRHMPCGYDPLIHQTPLTESFSFEEASSVPSFARFQRRFVEALASASSAHPTP